MRDLWTSQRGRMTLFDKIKILWKLNSFVKDELQEAKKMDSQSGKPGWKTSEFYLNLAGQIGILWGAIQGFIPPKYAAIIAVAGTAIYTVARTIAKAVSDIQATKATQATVTTTQPVTTVTSPA